MDQFIEKHKEEFDKAIEFVKKEISTIQTGRANPSLIDEIMVEVYGQKTPIKGLASIGVPEARTITIEPWDKNIAKDIEKAIREANVGLNPVNEGNLVRISIPQMTEESRKELIKLLGQKIEQGRIQIRGIRDEIRDEIIQAEKDNEITEDDKYKFQKDLDEFTGEFNKQIEEISKKKETEITKI